MSMAGGHHLAVHAAHRVGLTSVQCFTSNSTPNVPWTQVEYPC